MRNGILSIRNTLVSLTGLLLLSLSVFSQAAIAAEKRGIRIDVTAGYEKRFSPESSIPLTVVISSVRSVTGVLRVSAQSSDGSRSARKLSVEVPAGGRKQFHLLAPTTTDAALLVDFVASGKVVVSERVALIIPQDEVLVGWMEEALPAGLAGLKARATGAEVRAVHIPEGWADLGPDAMAPLAYVVVTGDRLRQGGDPFRQRLLDWTLLGGSLVIATADPNDLELDGGLSSDWVRQGDGWVGEPGPLGTIHAPDVISTASGLGEVIVVARPLSSIDGDRSLWFELIRSHESVVTAPGGFDGFRSSFDVANLLSRLNPTAVGLVWFLFFLVAYLLLVGPINYLVLKRLKRTELGWVTIPFLALFFCLVAYVLARGSRGGSALQQASMTFTTAAGSVGEQTVTVTSSRGGRVRLGFGTQDVKGLRPSQFGINQGLISSEVEVRAQGSDALIESSPFSVAAAEAGVAKVSGHLEATLQWDGVGFEGKVVNRTPSMLRGVTVRLAQAETNIGDLKPGASRDFTMVLPIRARGGGNQGFMGDPFGRDEDPEKLLRIALLSELDEALGLRTNRLSGLVYGFTDRANTEVRYQGKVVRPPGRGMIASPIHVTLADKVGSIPPAGGSVELVKFQGQGGGIQRFGLGVVEPMSINLQSFSEAIFLHRLPPAALRRTFGATRLLLSASVQGGGGFQPQPVAPGQVAPGVPPNFENLAPRIEVLDHTSGNWVELPVPPGRPNDTLRLDLPAGAISQIGETYIRMTPRLFPTLTVWGIGVEADLL